MKPTIAITMGDPAGVGPEVIVKSLASLKRTRTTHLLVIGNCSILQQTAKTLDVPLDFESVASIHPISHPEDSTQVLDPTQEELSCTPGETNPICGDHSFQYVKKGVELCLDQKIDAIVTAPICKQSWQLAGHKFEGHTELLAHLTATDQFKMMFGSDQLNVILSTTHLPLKDVSHQLTVQSVYDTIKMGDEEMKRLGIRKPQIAVCGLNPHAGEGGLFGHEEEEIIKPAIIKAIAKEVQVSGPYPADTIFLKALKGDIDLVVAQYHDQGLIPIKLLAFDTAVNITVGLPIIRTSVDHGTAFDIAGKGVADHTNMNHAIKFAQKLAMPQPG